MEFDFNINEYVDCLDVSKTLLDLIQTLVYTINAVIM